MQLVLHSDVVQLLDRLEAKLPQATLLTGPVGVGLSSIARQLAGRDLASVLEPEGAGNIISIKSIRELYEQTRSKNTSRQVIIIDEAERMTHSAQTAFLKLLEEPTAATYFILTSHAPQHLLPTISSRLQSFYIRAAEASQTDAMIESSNIKIATKQTQLKFMASGLPAELSRLMNDEMYFRERATVMGDARKLLQETAYQKLLIVQSYQKDRAKSLQLVQAAQKILQLSLARDYHPDIVSQLARLEQIYTQINNNASCRLQLARFVI